MVIDELNKHILSSEILRQLFEGINHSGQVSIKQLSGSLKSIVISYIFERCDTGIVYIVDDEETANFIKGDLDTLNGADAVAFFSDPKDRLYDKYLLDQYNKSCYQKTLEKVINNNKVISIISSRCLSVKVLSYNEIIKQRLTLKTGKEYDFEIFKFLLTELGFSREPVVENYGDMSIRGGIIDIYPFSRDHPLRIEFWGDRIESIREFDCETQRSFSNISHITIYPQYPREVQSIKTAQFVSLLDYFNEKTILIIEDYLLISKTIDDVFSEAKEEYRFRSKKEELIEPDKLFMCRSELEQNLSKYKKVFINAFSDDNTSIDFQSKNHYSLGGNFHHLKERLNYILNDENKHPLDGEKKIYFLCESKDRSERLEEIFREIDINTEGIKFSVCHLSQGFDFPDANLFVFTESQFYGRIHQWKSRKQSFKGISFRQLQSLKSGDYVVHVDHGIGRYVDLHKIIVGGNERECLMLEYRDKDKLYVPIEKMNRVQKYSAKEGVVPQINKLGSSDWERLKKRTKRRVKDIAEQLIKLYAQRREQSGFQFSKDSLWQKELEASFPYEDTTDQIKATEQIKQDMESTIPMERLVCGDVGYGKTEVALRAAFKAVNDNKQVAMLVPTTVLALQHFETFNERLKDHPVRIEMLSRFRLMSEQKKILEWLKNGKIDIIIGTHRLLSQDVTFNDLGLIIIDEEQRFGVQHKEKLKKIKSNVDILTMTATPIPRTLNMSLMGVRDMSIINTPPQGRLPIHTEIITFNHDIIRAAILKEVERGGQVFFVHNRIQSIYTISNLLKRLVPEVTFIIAHGQMDGRELERAMWDFAMKKYDCLISTMIIESGLDIPNVNTLIINRADRFGLSQLYQLRGRVGRSNQRAYAYLIAPPIQHLTKDAIKRLRTIEEFTELGSGLQIAMRDLQIRGAGNILGAEQSGFMVALGFELYYKILDEAVRELKAERERLAPPISAQMPETKVDLDVDAYLPDDYVSLAEERVNFYKRIAECTEQNQVSEMINELKDRFGPLPTQAENLMYLIEFKLLGVQLQLSNISINSKRLFIRFQDDIVTNQRELIHKRLVSIVDKAGHAITFVQGKDNSLGLKVPFTDLNDRLKFSKNFLQNMV